MRKDNSIYNKKQPGLYIFTEKYRLISGFLKKISSLCNFIKVTTRLTNKETN